MNGKESSTVFLCPNVDEWEKAFDDADGVFCVTITSNLSGSYNAASVAAKEYTEKHPNRKAHVVDTLSTGPESALIIEKLRELILSFKDFETIKKDIAAYCRRTHLIFSLESLQNLKNNGRVSAVTAKVAGIFGIRVVGQASLEGTLEVTDKAPGRAGAIKAIVKNMKKNGYAGGKIRIHHCCNSEAAQTLKKKILKEFPAALIEIGKTGGLCSYYAERGGLLVGFEGAEKPAMA